MLVGLLASYNSCVGYGHFVVPPSRAVLSARLRLHGKNKNTPNGPVIPWLKSRGSGFFLVEKVPAGDLRYSHTYSHAHLKQSRCVACISSGMPYTSTTMHVPYYLIITRVNARWHGHANHVMCYWPFTFCLSAWIENPAQFLGNPCANLDHGIQ